MSVTRRSNIMATLAAIGSSGMARAGGMAKRGSKRNNQKSGIGMAAA